MVVSLVKVDKKCHKGGGGGQKIAEKVSRIIWMAPKNKVHILPIKTFILLLKWEENVKVVSVITSKVETEQRQINCFHIQSPHNISPIGCVVYKNERNVFSNLNANVN